MLLSLPKIFHQPPRRFITRPDRAHLAPFHQTGKCFKNVLLSCAVVGPVGLIQIQIVRLQPSQGVLTRPSDLSPIQRCQAMPNLRPEPTMTRPCDLRRQNDPVTTPSRLQPLAHNLLRHSKQFRARWHRIHLCCIKKVDTCLHRPIHHRERLRLT